MAVNIDAFNVVYKRIELEVMKNKNLTKEDMEHHLNDQDEIVLITQAIVKDGFHLIATPFKLAFCYYPYKVFQQGILVKLQKKREETRLKAELKAKGEKAQLALREQQEKMDYTQRFQEMKVQRNMEKQR